ncbi:MAG: hypothetical protein RLZZ62_1076, partial [Actinomycetota bacterium]
FPDFSTTDQVCLTVRESARSLTTAIKNTTLFDGAKSSALNWSTDFVIDTWQPRVWANEVANCVSSTFAPIGKTLIELIEDVDAPRNAAAKSCSEFDLSSLEASPK